MLYFSNESWTVICSYIKCNPIHVYKMLGPCVKVKTTGQGSIMVDLMELPNYMYICIYLEANCVTLPTIEYFLAKKIANCVIVHLYKDI